MNLAKFSNSLTKQPLFLEGRYHVNIQACPVSAEIADFSEPGWGVFSPQVPSVFRFSGSANQRALPKIQIAADAPRRAWPAREGIANAWADRGLPPRSAAIRRDRFTVTISNT